MLLKNSTPLFIVRFFSPGTKDEKHMHMHVLPHVICIKQMNKERNKNTESSSWVAVYVCSYPLAISQVDLPKSGVKVWRGLALMVLIQEYRRTADLYAQLLCALTDADTETRRKTSCSWNDHKKERPPRFPYIWYAHRNAWICFLQPS